MLVARTIDMRDSAEEVPSPLAPAQFVRAPGGDTHATVRSLDQLPTALCAEWDALAEHASEANSFAERWFVMASAAHLAEASAVRMLEVREGGTLIGLMPVWLEDNFGPLPLRHTTNWVHHNAFLGTPLLRAGHEFAAWGAMLDALDAAGWAEGFLHINALVIDGPVHRALCEAAAARKRPCDIVHRAERALLETDLAPLAYYEATVRKKKRKELKRLQSRLAEQGEVVTRRLTEAGELWPWVDEFLALEASGWKGKSGSALRNDAATERFFRAALAGAWEAGRLEILRMDLNGHALAMLVNFLAAPGSFSFKIAFDEDFARYSPGVLIQLENYGVLDHPGIRWMDSCAVENHPMINSLWGERRTLVRVSVPLSGAWRGLQFHGVRAAERASAALKRLRGRTSQPQAAETDDD